MKPYREEDDSTFESNGKVYSLNKLFAQTDKSVVVMYPVSRLRWVLKYCDPDSQRVAAADLTAPLLIAEVDKRILTVDGLHRLTKAVNTNVSALPVKILSSRMLENALISEGTKKFQPMKDLNLSANAKRIINDLVTLSTSDNFLGDIALQKNLDDLVPMIYNDQIVGFAIPRKEKDGKWRTGPVFIHPSYRNKGIMSKFIREFFMDKDGMTYINPDNIASITAFTKAGFKKTGKSYPDESGTLDQYILIHKK